MTRFIKPTKLKTFPLPLVLPCGGLGYDGSIAYPRYTPLTGPAEGTGIQLSIEGSIKQTKNANQFI